MVAYSENYSMTNTKGSQKKEKCKENFFSISFKVRTTFLQAVVEYANINVNMVWSCYSNTQVVMSQER